MTRTTTRRDFLKQTSAGLLTAAAAGPALAQGESAAGFPTRAMGRSGEQISLLGIGGFHVGTFDDEKDAIRLLHEAVDMGVTFMDNAWEYHDGRSEEIMGKALQGQYREKAFLMTKHHGRDKKTAMQHLDDSLRRLKTDVIDLWQFHEIVYPKDAEMIFADGGGIEAAIQAKESGKVRYIGFTGHKDPEYFLQMLDHDYLWDAVQMPLNAFDPHYKSFEKTILPILLERQIGVLAMKTLGSRILLDSNKITAEEALRYAMSLPVSTVISGITSLDELRKNAEVARTLKPMTMAERTALLERTREAAVTGEYELYKSTNRFNGPVGRKLHGVG